MGTFSVDRNEYDDPEIPALFSKGSTTRKAFMRGWRRGIWNDHPNVGRIYGTSSLQRAAEAGYAEAHATRRGRGEQF